MNKEFEPNQEILESVEENLVSKPRVINMSGFIRDTSVSQEIQSQQEESDVVLKSEIARCYQALILGSLDRGSRQEATTYLDAAKYLNKNGIFSDQTLDKLQALFK